MNFAAKFKLPLSKTVAHATKVDENGKPEKERVQVGFALVPYPTLSDFGIKDAVQAKNEKGELDFDEVTGVPLLSDDKYQWLQEAIIDKMSAKVRNYYIGAIKEQDAAKVDAKNLSELQPDSGKALPVDFETLVTEGRSGEALKIRREAKASFENYLRSQDRPQAVIDALGNLFFNSSRVLGSASEKYVQALDKHTTAWIEKLDPKDVNRFDPKIRELNDSINSAKEKEELDLV